jgi:hypothetical protein
MPESPPPGNYAVTTCASSDLSDAELATCLEIIKNGGAVAVDLKKLRSAQVLAVAKNNGEIVGVGTIKEIRPRYACSIARKSGVTFPSFTPELGYVAVDSNHRLNRLSHRIVAELTSKHEGALFVTTSDEAMRRVLTKAEFKQQRGKEWKGKRGDSVSLWLKGI